MKFHSAIFFIFLGFLLGFSDLDGSIVAHAEPSKPGQSTGQASNSSPPSFLDNSRVYESSANGLTKKIRDDVFDGNRLSIQDLQKRLPHYSQPADVLADLIKTNPLYQTNAVLLFGSESQQIASPTSPRVLIFGAGMIFGFSEASKTVPRIEIAQLNSLDNSVTLAEIRFESQKVILDANPKSCVTCHGKPSKLLWEPYDFWQGSFGSAAGRFNTKTEENLFSTLIAEKNKSKILKQLNLNAYSKSGEESIIALTQFVSIANLNQYAAKLQLDPSKADHLRLLSVLSLCHTDVNDFFSSMYSEPQQTHERQSFEATKAELDAAQSHFINFSDRRYFNNLGLGTEATKIDHQRLQRVSKDLDKLALWLLHKTGNSLDGISLSLHANLFDFHTPSQMAIELMTSILETQSQIRSQLPFKTVDLYTGSQSWLQTDCQHLKNKLTSAPATSGTTASFPNFRESRPQLALLSRCSKCHSERLGFTMEPAPYIPFERPALLSNWIQDTKMNFEKKIIDRIEAIGTNKQMPPQSPLNADEIEALKEFLKALKQ